MDTFETTSKIDKNTFRQMRRYLMPQGQHKLLQTAIVIAGVLALGCVLLKKTTVALVLAAGALAFIVEYVVLLNRHVRLNVKRMEETWGTRDCTYTTLFTDRGFELRNHRTGGVATVAYENLARFVETQDYYAVFTKENQLGVINKAEINKTGKKEALVAFLKERCEGILV